MSCGQADEMNRRVTYCGSNKMITIGLDIDKERPSFLFRSAIDENIRVMPGIGGMINNEKGIDLMFCVSNGDLDFNASFWRIIC